MLYQEWGFSKSPFDTESLSANSVGERLLVARETELRSLKRRIGSGPKMATVEGLNGVGKTSVVNVASYQLFRDNIDHDIGQLFIPCRSLFQLETGLDTQDFQDHVLREVAQTLIEQAAFLVAGEKVLDVKTLDRLNKWLNAPQIEGFTAGAWGFSYGNSKSNNTSEGFDRSGFRKVVTDWLGELFPHPEQSGVVCVLDNLELLQTSESARRTLEALRDSLFAIKGLRWVLCGARGIVFGIASSPRLAGRLHAPVEIKSIADSAAPEIFNSRIEIFRQDDHAYMPLLASDFDDLYKVLRGNLRDVLSDADNYCQWVADRDLPRSDQAKHDMFVQWLNGRCEDAFASISSEVKPRAMEVFTQAIEMGTSFSPGDFEAFRFKTQQAFRPSLQTLESVGLIASTIDESDQRRRTIQILPKGFLVSEYLQKREMT